MAELLGITIAEVLDMDEWEFQVWREEYQARNLANHAAQEHSAVRALLASRKRGRS